MVGFPLLSMLAGIFSVSSADLGGAEFFEAPGNLIELGHFTSTQFLQYFFEYYQSFAKDTEKTGVIINNLYL